MKVYPAALNQPLPEAEVDLIMAQSHNLISCDTEEAKLFITMS